MHIRRNLELTTLIASATGAALGATWSVPAQAAPGAPVGQCPPPYTLAEATTPVALDLDSGPGGNADGWICRLPATHGPLVGTANLIDNHVPLQVTFE